jgi:hypothetical protein
MHTLQNKRWLNIANKTDIPILKDSRELKGPVLFIAEFKIL